MVGRDRFSASPSWGRVDGSPSARSRKIDFALAVREPPELATNFVRKQSLFLLFGCFAKVNRLAACHQPDRSGVTQWRFL
jgi:hypothetical protein